MAQRIRWNDDMKATLQECVDKHGIDKAIKDLSEAFHCSEQAIRSAYNKMQMSKKNNPKVTKLNNPDLLANLLVELENDVLFITLPRGVKCNIKFV